MRNLSRYPITKEEVIDVLQKIPEDNPPGTPADQISVGGINDLIRAGLIEYVRLNIEQVLEGMNL